MIDNLLKVFGGENSRLLTKNIASYLKIPMGSIYHHTFPTGEYYVQYSENIRGCDIFLVQSAGGLMNSTNALMQLLIMADAAKRASADRITAVCPLFFYQRQDRKDKSRVPISAKLVMDILAAAGIDRIVTMDLHAPQIAGFTNLPFDHLHFRPSLAEAVRNKKIHVIVAPDIGAVKKAEEFAQTMKVDLAFISKKRKDDTTVEVTQFVGDVTDKNVLIVDDLTESAGTLVNAASCCKKNGAKTVYCAVSHNCLSSLGISRLITAKLEGSIDGFFCSDSTDVMNGSEDWFTVVSVAEIFSKAIHGIHNNHSISSLFV